MLGNNTNPFSDYFDINNQKIEELTIKENGNQDNCYIYHGAQIYGGFLLIDNPQVKTLLKVSFYKSTINQSYIPRLEFRKTDKNGVVKQSRGIDVIIKFSEGDEARAFWKVIHFLQGFKNIVDLGDFHSKYQAVSFETYLVEFNNKQQADKLKELASLTENIKFTNEEIKDIFFVQRRKCIHWFYALLKNLSNNEGVKAFDSYRHNHNIKEPGDEAVWHHFLKNNDWIIGLNIDIKFIRDLLSEQKVGIENSKGKGSPKVDLLGYSYFTTLIELKTSKTPIFKSNKTNTSRTNTWDFSNDFIEAYSQVLAQRSEISPDKDIVDEQGNILDTKKYRILDPKAVLIIGNRNVEFPHIRNTELDIKTDCFERFRRDIRNIEIITYDELFERAYHIVYPNKLPKDWHEIEADKFKKDVLKL